MLYSNVLIRVMRYESTVAFDSYAPRSEEAIFVTQTICNIANLQHILTAIFHCIDAVRYEEHPYIVDFDK